MPPHGPDVGNRQSDSASYGIGSRRAEPYVSLLRPREVLGASAADSRGSPGHESDFHVGEEKAADEKLTQIAESGINREAARAAHSREEGARGRKSAGRKTAPTKGGAKKSGRKAAKRGGKKAAKGRR